MGTVLSVGAFGFLSGCFNNSKPDTLVLMSEELSGLFNPFFYSAGADGTIVGQTQISMFTTDREGNIAFGDEEAVVVKNYEKKYDAATDKTTYNFVLKNGLKFSDGKPLTMNDVLFNMYVYLDPAYTGSTTMYSTDIDGLQRYRTQQDVSGDGSQEDEALNTGATALANSRAQALLNLYEEVGDPNFSGNYNATPAQMRSAINALTSVENGYKEAIGETDDAKARTQMLADYNRVLELFEEELENDYKGSKDAYWNTEPYKYTQEFTGAHKEIVAFLYAEGYVTIEYERDPVTGKEDKTRIKSVNTRNLLNTINTEEKAIEYVFNDKVARQLNSIINFWGTGNKIKTEFQAKAKDVILHKRLEENGGNLIYNSIRGIKSLGHETETKGTSLTVNGTAYTIASDHNADGTVKNSNEYDVLSITVNGIDPKAEWNFGFTVAPYHYYSDPTQDDLKVDIEKGKFGVRWAEYDFMSNVIQGKNSWGASKNSIPLGAGPYMASDRNYETATPADNAFSPSTSVAYYKANPNFIMGEAKIKKMCYQVVSANNALGVLKDNSVHYIEPQYTDTNFNELQNLKSQGYNSVSSWQLGYGYIGINAGKVTDVNLRKAIMSAMDTKLVLNYYRSGTAANIAWPMSIVNWAYPRVNGATIDPSNYLKDRDENNGTEHDYTRFPQGANAEEQAKEKIKNYMRAAGIDPDNCAGDSRLNIKFTIAGTNVNEHPTYNTFLKARTLLNACGWNVEISPDQQALIKLSTGSLTVWAAAWSSTIDPDMYQVYHKNSSATSTLAWGYREILANQGSRREENNILTELSALIDSAREIDNQEDNNGEPGRKTLYRQAMGKVLDLAVELPCYQRQVLYAYNANVIKASSLPSSINPYSSPLEKIWEVEFVD